jgi:hypothetical protein
MAIERPRHQMPARLVSLVACSVVAPCKRQQRQKGSQRQAPCTQGNKNNNEEQCDGDGLGDMPIDY